MRRKQMLEDQAYFALLKNITGKQGLVSQVNHRASIRELY